MLLFSGAEGEKTLNDPSQADTFTGAERKYRTKTSCSLPCCSLSRVLKGKTG
jgi:hypothetical protein